MEEQQQEQIKQRVQTIIVSISVFLLIGKFIAFFVTNSVGILTDAMESIVNVIAGVVSLYSIKAASKPKDKGHPFGHGKIELLSASAEAILIIIAGIVIVMEGVKRLFESSEISKLDVGIWIIVIAGIVNYIMGAYSIKIGKKYNSMALIAGGKHLQSDTYSTIGLVAGLVALHLTGYHWIDSALAMIFGLVIVKTGIGILIKTAANLTDKADNAILDEISKALLNNRKPEWIDVHNAKSIRYGSYIYIDCDLTLPWYYNIKEGHDACDEIKDTLNKEFNGKILITIHSDPCKSKHCCHCEMSECVYRQHTFATPYKFDLIELTESDDEKI